MRVNRIRASRRRSVVSACALALLVAASGTVSAQAPPGAPEGDSRLELERPGAGPRARAVQDGPVSLEQAVALVRRRFEGRVVSAETRDVDGRRVHVIRMLDNGRVRDVQVDAATGRIRR